MRRREALGLGGTVVLLGLALWWWLRPPPPPRPAPPEVREGAEVERPRRDEAPRAVAREEVPRTAVTGAEVLGLNEAVSVSARSRALVRSPLQAEAVLLARASRTRDLGVRLVRANSHSFPELNVMALEARDFDWSEADTFFRATGSLGLDVVAVVGPWPGARTAAYTDHYLPDDLEAYEEAITRLVERYDGDGLRDMPGLKRPVLAWEIDNEPDLHHLRPPRGAEGEAPRTDFQTPAEYAEIVRRTSAAVRAADEEALILAGGLYRITDEASARYLEEVLAEPGVYEAFDALSLHCYFSGDGLVAVAETMAAARAQVPDKPVWITETSVPSDGRHAWVSPGWQAEMVVGIVGAFLAEGADRVLWHTLVDPPPRTGDDTLTYGSNGLLMARGPAGLLGGEDAVQEKPAAAVFARLAEALAPTSTESYRELPVAGGRVLATDQGWLVFRGTVTPPAGARTALDLRSGEEQSVAELGEEGVSAPAWLSP